MKTKYLLIAALAGLALVGCNKEKGSDSNELKPSGESNYMGFTIAMPSATKADPDPGTFESGKDYENAIKSIHFFFYKHGAYVSYGYGDVVSRFTDANATNPVSGGNVEEIRDGGEDVSNPTIRKGVVVLESTMAMPDQVLCVINSRNAGWYRNKSLATVTAALHSGKAESLTGNTNDSYKDFQADGPYFVMSTAPMYGSDADGNKEVKYVTDILVEQDASGNFTANSYIQSTIAAAEARPLEVYVERMAARVEIDNLDGASSILDANGFIKAANLDAAMKDASNDPLWDINPIAWGVTAHNKKAYCIKHVGTGWWGDATYTGWLESGTQVPNPLKSSENMYTRINWCTDPNYSTSDVAFSNRQAYPHSARQYYGANEEKYWSASEIKAHYDGAEKSAADILQRYCYENTFDKDGQKNNPRINGTMILLYAQAKVHNAANYEDLFAYMGQTYTYAEYVKHLLSTIWAHGSEFYVNDGGYKGIVEPTVQNAFADKSSNYLKIVRSTTMNQFFGADQFGPYTRNIIETASANDGSQKIKDLYLDWVIDMGTRAAGTVTLQPNTFDSAFPVINSFTQNDEKGYADGYVTLIPGTAMPTLYVIDTNTATNPAYDAGTPDSEYRAITDAEKVQAFLGHVVEPANMYRDGKMYYAITLQHFGEAKSGDDPLEGNYGVVRNNLYRVSIGQVKSLGHGIDDVDEPIIPGDRKNPFYLAAKINILSWQIARQTVNLEE